MKKILSYNSCISEQYQQLKMPQYISFGANSNNTDVSEFFGKFKEVKHCSICNERLNEIYCGSSSDSSFLQGGSLITSENIWACNKCGWWKTRRHVETVGSDMDGESFTDQNAVLQKFDLSDIQTPVDELRKYLITNSKDIISVHETSMEKLVQSVFSDYYTCDVEHVGRSNDGGIDLYFVNASKPTVVQVKRRKSLSVTESVSGIREFIGAALLKNSKNLIYVSTCSHFSRESIMAANKAVKNGIVDSYQLYDYQRFIDALNFVADNVEKPWEQHFKIKT